MKRLLKIGVYSLLLFLTIYLGYKQWFSTARPVLYFPPTETIAPNQLNSLTVIKDEEQITLSTNSSSYSIFVFDYPDQELKNEVARSVQPLHDTYESNGLSIYYLWLINEKSFPAKYVSSFLDSSHSYLVPDRQLKGYQDHHGLYISSTPFIAVYNQSGQKVTQFDFPIHRETIGNKLLNIPRYEILNNQ